MGTPLVLGDRVLVQTTTTGTGTYQLGAALQGHLTLAQAGIPTGARVSYTVVDSLTSPEFFEVVEGVYTAGSPATLTRGQVFRTAGGGTSAVNWPLGTRYILIGPSAARLVLFDTEGHLNLAVGRYLGIGASPDAPLTIQAKADAVAQKIRGRASDGAAVLQFVTPDNLQERARLQSTADGGLLIATGAGADPAALADGAQNVMFGKVTLNPALLGMQFTRSSNLALLTSVGPGLGVRRNDTDGPLVVFYRNDTPSGTISCAGATVAYNTTSDGRLKDVEREIEGAEAEDVIRRLRPISYRWKHAPEAGSFAGFISQEYGQVLPRGVTPGHGEPGDADFMPMGMTNDAAMPYVVALLNHAMERIAALEAAAAPG